jgi:hypothetical protein
MEIREALRDISPLLTNGEGVRATSFNRVNSDGSVFRVINIGVPNTH